MEGPYPRSQKTKLENILKYVICSELLTESEKWRQRNINETKNFCMWTRLHAEESVRACCMQALLEIAILST